MFILYFISHLKITQFIKLLPNELVVSYILFHKEFSPKGTKLAEGDETEDSGNETLSESTGGLVKGSYRR